MSSHALTTDTVPGLAETLRQCRLLSSSQQETLQELRGRFTDPRALAGELIERGWLTAYQVNQLFLGRGGELLLDSYIILDRLGAGASGQVFKARHQHMQRIAALKVIRKELLSDSEVLQRFYREIQVTSQISHANVVHAYDAGPIGANHMLVMEYVEGTDLHQRVKESGLLPAALACDYIRQAALGLQHIHECELVHRDLKPSNLLVTPDGQVKILDLGLARLQPSNARQAGAPLTQIGAGMMGTPDYLAPEQAISLSNVDIRADIYSLGCTFFFLLTGQPPFAGGTLAQKLLRHQQAPVPSVRQQLPKLPKELDRILGRMLAKKPEQRYPTPGALAQDLVALLRNRSLRLGKEVPPLRASDKRSRPASPTGPAGRRQLSGRRKLQLALAALLLTGGLVGGLLVLIGQRPESSRAEAQAVVGPAVQTGVGPATQAVVRPAPQAVVRPVTSRPTSEKRLPVQPQELVATWGEARGRHWGPVNSVAFAADGKQLASGGNDRVVRIWDAASRGELAVLGDGPNAVSLVAYSPGGRTLVACSRETNERPAELRTWDASTFKLLRTVPLAKGEDIVAMHFAPDGQTFFTLARRLENRQTGAQIKFYDAQTGQEKKPPVTVLGNFRAMRLAADGKMLATAMLNQCTVWGGDNFQKLSSFAPAGTSVATMAFAPNGQTLAVAVSRGTQAQEIKLMDPATGKEKLTMPAQPTLNTVLEWSPDNQLLAVAGQRNEAGRLELEVQVLDASNGQKRTTLPVQGLPVSDMAFAPDNKTLATCGQDHNVRLWDLATGKERVPNETGHRVAVNLVSFAADDRSLVSLGANGDPTAKTWDVATGREQSSLNLAASTRNWSSTHVLLAHDQQHLLIWAPQGVKYWDIGAGRERDVLSSPTNEVRGAAISPDGKSVAVALTKNVRLWDAASGQERQLPVPLTQFANLLFSPDSKILAIADLRLQPPRGIVHFWDLATGRERSATATVADRVQGITFAADGQTLAISHGNGEIRRWDLTGGKDQGALPGTFQPRPLLLAAPKGPGLAAWDAQTLRVWDATTGRERFNVAGAWSRAVAFSRDGQKLAAAASDGRVLVWNATSGSKLFEWKAPGPILSLGFSSDGQRLATGNSNGTIGILQVP